MYRVMKVKRIQKLTQQLMSNLDFLIGSVVMYRLKCGKDCTCNKGKKHICYYLSTKKEGKTKNLYLPPKAVKEAKKMSQRYKKVKIILEKISQANYEQLKKNHLTRKQRSYNGCSRKIERKYQT